MNFIDLISNTTNTSIDVAALISAILYPLVFLIVFLVLRKQLPDLIKGISGRLTKIEIAGISLELAKAEPFNPNWQLQGALDLRQSMESIHINDSGAGNFEILLSSGGMADYAIVNLGKGKEWLASRLYIMTIIFQRVKGINGIVFLESSENTRKKFIGWAKPEQVRWALAQKFPWLEDAYANAYLDNDQQVQVVSNQGRLAYSYNFNDNRASVDLLRNFLKKIQSPPEIQPLPTEEDEWITLPSKSTNKTKEHTIWLSAEILEDILDDVLITKYINNENELPKIENQIKHFLISPNPFIAMVNYNYRFDYLVKRDKLLAQILS